MSFTPPKLPPISPQTFPKMIMKFSLKTFHKNLPEDRSKTAQHKPKADLKLVKKASNRSGQEEPFWKGENVRNVPRQAQDP